MSFEDQGSALELFVGASNISHAGSACNYYRLIFFSFFREFQLGGSTDPEQCQHHSMVRLSSDGEYSRGW